MKSFLKLLFILFAIQTCYPQWSQQSSGITAHFYGVYFINDSTGWVVGNARIIKTTDGGSSWIVQPSGATGNLNSIFFISDTIGWAVGDNGTILKTINSGSNWIPQNSGTSESLKSVLFLTDSIGFELPHIVEPMHNLVITSQALAH